MERPPGRLLGDQKLQSSDGPSPIKGKDPSGRPTVKFASNPFITVIESSSRKRPFAMFGEIKYQTFQGSEVSDLMLIAAAKLFSENYGIWGQGSPKSGERVKLGPCRLRNQYLPGGVGCSYTMVTVDGTLAGNAFVARWKYNVSNICWVTQLVVHKDYRERGLARGLLQSLMADEDDVYGIMSSHPAACLASARSFRTRIEKVPLDFMRNHADAIMKASPIPYIRDAEPCGRLFDPEDTTGMVSGVNTRFWVDHEEPLEALKSIYQDWQWPLGDLPDGREYLLILQARHRRSRSSSKSVGKAM